MSSLSFHVSFTSNTKYLWKSPQLATSHWCWMKIRSISIIRIHPVWTLNGIFEDAKSASVKIVDCWVSFLPADLWMRLNKRLSFNIWAEFSSSNCRWDVSAWSRVVDWLIDTQSKSQTTSEEVFYVLYVIVNRIRQTLGQEVWLLDKWFTCSGKGVNLIQEFGTDIGSVFGQKLRNDRNKCDQQTAPGTRDTSDRLCPRLTDIELDLAAPSLSRQRKHRLSARSHPC